MREKKKAVSGVGGKNATSDLLTANCHEFIYYDDLLRESDTQKQAQRKRSARQGKAKPKPDSAEARKQEAFDLVTEVIEDIAKERGEEEKGIGRASWRERGCQ